MNDLSKALSVDHLGTPVRMFAAANQSERAMTLDRVVDGSRRILNLVVAGARCDGGNDEMIQVRLLGRDALVGADPLKASLREMWDSYVRLSDTAVCRFIDTISGFEFRFTLVGECGDVVTGLVSVDLMPGLA